MCSTIDAIAESAITNSELIANTESQRTDGRFLIRKHEKYTTQNGSEVSDYYENLFIEAFFFTNAIVFSLSACCGDSHNRSGVLQAFSTKI